MTWHRQIYKVGLQRSNKLWKQCIQPHRLRGSNPVRVERLRIGEDWIRLRIANIAPVQQSGTYLDIGCANGYLLECLVIWARLKGVEIIPYGLDYSAKLAVLARQRVQFSSNIYVGNAWNWTPPQCFDYVRTELDYVPRNYRKPFIERLLAEFVVQEGRLIISQYRSRHDDLTQDWVDQELEGYGFRVVEVHSGYDGDGLELCRAAVLQP